MLYTELQLSKSETIGEMFNVAQKVALVEGSAQESHIKRKDQHSEVPLLPFDRRGNNRTRKT